MKIKYGAGGLTKQAVMEGEAIKPCPFCGSTLIELTNTHTPVYWMECQGCGAEVTGESFATTPQDNEMQHIAAAESALAAWNRRDSV